MNKKKVIVLFTIFCVVIASAVTLYTVKFGFLQEFPNAEFLTTDEEYARPVYAKLTKKEKAVYTALYRGISNRREDIPLPFDIKGDEYSKVYRILEKQEGEFFYLDSVYFTAKRVRNAKIAYKGTDDSTMRSAELDAAVEKAVSGGKRVRGGYYLAQYIQNYLIDKCTYTLGGDGGYASTAYGCLVEGKANCEGYAKAFNLLAAKMGLQSVVVMGTADNGDNHAWNQVCIGSDWYNMDVTWADTDIAGEVRYEYFLRPDLDFYKSHFVDDELFEPFVCAKDDWNYFKSNGLFASSVSEAREITIRELGMGNYEFGISFENRDTYENYKYEISNEPSLLRMIEESGCTLTGQISVTMEENPEEKALIVKFSSGS